LRIEGGTLIGKALPIPQIAIDQRIGIDNYPLQALIFVALGDYAGRR